ncbi:MAG: hypothetical protein WD733_24065, partial [Bryobacterales bacterium]
MDGEGLRRYGEVVANMLSSISSFVPPVSGGDTLCFHYDAQVCPTSGIWVRLVIMHLTQTVCDAKKGISAMQLQKYLR